MGEEAIPLKAITANLPSAVANANRPAMADKQGTPFDALTLAQDSQVSQGKDWEGGGADPVKAVVFTAEINEDTHRRATLAQGRLRKAEEGFNLG